MNLRHLRQLGTEFKVPIKPDAGGFTGRECPEKECLGNFKVQFGTGLKGENLPCHCPYCGHTGRHDTFWTQEQLEYARSVVLHKVTEALHKDLKSLEFESRPRGSFGIGISLKVQGRPVPIRYYREKKLETEIVCDRCTLRYAIYGLFAFCPDCGAHNSLQILNKNLDLAVKEVALAQEKHAERELAEQLIADALENAVSAFDGFGREAVQIALTKAAPGTKTDNISFQRLTGAQKRLQDLLKFDLANGLSQDEWRLVCTCFQKRHVLAHAMGVVDEAYLHATNDPTAVIGRKVTITPDEVVRLITLLRKLGSNLIGQLPGLSPPSGGLLPVLS